VKWWWWIRCEGEMVVVDTLRRLNGGGGYVAKVTWWWWRGCFVSWTLFCNDGRLQGTKNIGRLLPVRLLRAPFLEDGIDVDAAWWIGKSLFDDLRMRRM